LPVSKDKPSRLLGLVVSYKGKKLYNIDTRIPFDFIGKLETLEDDLKVLKTKFPDEIRSRISEIFSRKKNASVGKSAETSRKYFRQLPKDLILKLYRAYELDFLIGGYPFPGNYVDLGY
jgi:hypothetical protein